MKVLKTYLVLSLLYSALVADDNLDKFISNYKAKEFEYDYQKNESQSSILRDSWISPINLNYSYTKNNSGNTDYTSKTTSINLDQPVFKSGGIYYGIKYAEANYKYVSSTIDSSKQMMVKNALLLLMQIKQTDLKIQKQKLLIKNADINLDIKKEQYLNGQLDSGFLDSAIIDRNTVISALYDIQTSKERLISQFETISDVDYEKAVIPNIAFITKEEFLNHNIVLDIAKNNNLQNDFHKDMVITKYLPTVSITAGYNWSKSEVGQVETKDDYYNYGFRVTIPLNINTFRDIQSSKIDYLKSKVDMEDKKRELSALYDQVMQNLKNIDKKINLSQENKKIYKKLLEDTKKLYEVGYKTSYDVELLSNSYEIQNLDIKVLDIDKSLELLTLYESYKR